MYSFVEDRQQIHFDPTMSFGCGVGDIIAISGLAIKVYTTYKDAPDDYRNILDEVRSLRILIDKAAPYFGSIQYLSTMPYPLFFHVAPC